MNPSSPDYLEGAVQGTVIWLRVAGRGSFKLGPTLKAFVVSALQRGCRRVLLDLQSCTVMGVLAGLALHLKPLHGTVTLLHLDERNRGALSTLGLDRLLVLQPADDLEATPVPALQRIEITPDVAHAAASILAAHENLITAAPENQTRFHELVTQLKEEINPPH